MSDQIRVVVVSNENGTNEDVIFTEEFDVPATDFCARDQTVDIDKLIDNNLPSGFPTDFTLTVKK